MPAVHSVPLPSAVSARQWWGCWDGYRGLVVGGDQPALCSLWNVRVTTAPPKRNPSFSHWFLQNVQHFGVSETLSFPKFSWILHPLQKVCSLFYQLHKLHFFRKSDQRNANKRRFLKYGTSILSSWWLCYLCCPYFPFFSCHFIVFEFCADCISALQQMNIFDPWLACV